MCGCAAITAGLKSKRRFVLSAVDGHLMKDSFKLSHLTDFEAFVLNLYYNGTKIIMDEDDVDEDPYFDIDD